MQKKYTTPPETHPETEGRPTPVDDAVRAGVKLVVIRPGRPETPSVPPSKWTERYGQRHLPSRIMVPGSRDGRSGRVSFFERNGNLLLRWREDSKDRSNLVRVSEHANPMAEALRRAANINKGFSVGRGAKRGTGTTVREACAVFLDGKESASDCSGPTITKYRQELDRVVEFAEETAEGQRCGHIHEVDTPWCQAFCSWLDGVRTTRNGGPVTRRNPERLLSPYQKQQIRRRLARMIDAAIMHKPPLVPDDFESPMTGELIGRRPEDPDDLSDPPVSVEELAVIVPELDEYGLALLAPLFLFGPRTSEPGRVLPVDFDAECAALKVICRPATGYRTKGRRNKMWPVSPVLEACLRPFLGRSNGPLFPKRWIFEGKGNPALLEADEARLAVEFDRRRVEEAERLGRVLKKAEVEKLSERVWIAAGAVTARDIRRELKRAAKKAGLAETPTPLGARHLFETLCEEARLASGVIRHLMGHRPKRGDSLPKYYHARLAALREQVAILDGRRQPLINALSQRASELARRR